MSMDICFAVHSGMVRAARWEWCLRCAHSGLTAQPRADYVHLLRSMGSQAQPVCCGQGCGRSGMSELLDESQRRRKPHPQQRVLCGAPLEGRLHLLHPLQSPPLRQLGAGAVAKHPLRRAGVQLLRVVGELAARSARHGPRRLCWATTGAGLACNGSITCVDGGCENQASFCLLDDLYC